MLGNLKSFLEKQSDFTRNVLVLVSGTALAQLLPILASFFLTRLYSPEEFGIFTLVSSLIAFGSVVVTGRYEVAIVLPKEERVAKELAAMATLLAFTASCVLFLAVLFFKTGIANLIGLKAEYSNWLYWVPPFIFLTGQQKILDFIVNRQQKFKLLAKNKVGRSISLSVTQLGLGYVKYSGGLIVGSFIGVIYSVLLLIKRQDWPIKSFAGLKLRETARKYIKFPTYSLAADSINSFSNQIPVILITLYFAEEYAGYYGFTLRILSLPLALIASSFLDVFKHKAASEYIELGNCKDIYVKTLKKLVLISSIPFAILALIAPHLFALFFGEEWRQAGVYSQIMCIMFFFRFIASPLSYVLYIANKQNYDLVWQIILAGLTVISFKLGDYYNDIHIALWSFSIAYSLMYLVYLRISYKLSLGIN